MTTNDETTEVLLWALVAFLMAFATTTVIVSDQLNHKPECISVQEAAQGGLLLNAESKNNVCKD